MGYNSTVVVYNDALDDIAGDADFGRKFAAAVQQCQNGYMPRPGASYVPFAAGRHANAGMVIESHHADHMCVVAVGGNLGKTLGYGGYYRATEEEILRTLARDLGYDLVKRA